MMYDIKFDKNRLSCLLFRQNSKLYNLTTENCVSQKILYLKNELIRSLDSLKTGNWRYIHKYLIYIGYLFLLKENL